MGSPTTVQLFEGGVLELSGGSVARLKLLGWLGGGGFANVWLGKDLDSGVCYAAKVFQGLRLDSAQMARVRGEAALAIPSPYILPALGLYQLVDVIWVVLFPYVEARDLRTWMAEVPLEGSGERRLKVFRQILQGVSDAHTYNIIHRDLKPENILVGDGDQVKIIDFGIAKFKDSEVTGSGEVQGTREYMAPELFYRGGMKAADARADIFALGQILYELSMGRCFWEYKGFRNLKDMFRFLREHTVAVDLSDFTCPFLPRASELLESMLAVSPELRPASVAEVLRLVGCEDSRPAGPPEPEPLDHLPFLVVESGENRGAMTPVGLPDGGRLEIGRSSVAGGNEAISRRHAELSRHGETYYIRDLGSANGTFIQGLRLPSMPDAWQPLRHGDRIRLADTFTRLVFLDPETGQQLPHGRKPAPEEDR